MVGLGGDDVDHWLVEHLVRADLRELPEWHRDLLWEAMWLKERVSREGSGEFRWRGIQKRLTTGEMTELLGRRGLYDQLRKALRTSSSSSAARVWTRCSWSAGHSLDRGLPRS